MSALISALPFSTDTDQDGSEMDGKPSSPSVASREAAKSSPPHSPDAFSNSESQAKPLLPSNIDEEAFVNESAAPAVKAGWMEKDTVRRNILGIFPNAGRHKEVWKRRWFILYEDGTLAYYRYRDAVDLDDLWAPSGGELFFDKNAAPKDFIERGDEDTSEREADDAGDRGEDRRETVVSLGGRKILELRSVYILTKSSSCKRHVYHSTSLNVLSIQIDKKTEILVRCEDDESYLSWLAAFNNLIDKLLESSIAEKTGRGFRALGDYVSLKIDLNRSITMDDDDSDDEEGENENGTELNMSDFVHIDSPKSRPACIPPPSLNILILVVGTRGDVAPFVAMGLKLKEAGHRVRIATHAMYRKTVTSANLLFYPLAGDPVKLSGFMVKTQGKLIPNLLDRNEIRDHAEDIPEKLQMLEEICQSTWPACVSPDPEDESATPFVAEAIISNPVTYGHSHCAEKLGVPLHMFFPQPWTPTKAFPHVFASMDQGRGWSKENEWSYYAVDQFFWLGTEAFINEFRETTLGLPKLMRGELGGHRLNTLCVPFCYMFSPNLVPKPKDWPKHTDIVGNFFAAGKSTHTDEALQTFLDKDPDNVPIFVGFGSMVIEDPDALAQKISGAASATNTRIILQSSWSKMAADDNPLIYCLGNCPHDWLFPQCAAVVHHGGAGTVAAGLRASKPTLVCPFFGDQHFWGEVVSRSGCGPKPIPAQNITEENLSSAFRDLKSEKMKKKAQAMAKSFESEDGVGNGIKCFIKQLPIEDMVCDVSLFLPQAHCDLAPKTLSACRWCSECQMKLSLEVDAVVHAKGTGRSHHNRSKYVPVDWGTMDGPSNAINGFAQGVFGMGQEMVGALTGVIVEPVKGGRKDGIKGGIIGVGRGLKDLVLRPLKGGLILVDKTSAGVSAHMQKQSDDSKTPFRRFVFYDKLHAIGTRIGETLSKPGGDVVMAGKGVTEQEVKESAERLAQLTPDFKADILHAFEIARDCKEIFVKSEEARLNGMPSNASPIMMRTLTNAIAESRKGTSIDRESTATRGQAGEGGKEDISVIFDSYFGVKGGKMMFAEFVSQFLFSNEKKEEGPVEV